MICSVRSMEALLLTGLLRIVGRMMRVILQRETGKGLLSRESMSVHWGCRVGEVALGLGTAQRSCGVRPTII
jgi:hypothetical protein